jgi:RNA polymerase sigma factor (sigma-70 family)
MVWGVCRRVLRSHQDAEDAFQAAFLVLVRKAASVVPGDMVANWLYGVAHQTALKARATAARRGAREKQVSAMPEPAVEQKDLWNDLQPLLDHELRQLPDKYRAVIVLCHLEGKTRKEAARHLGLPEGTVASRLATARALLAKRLTRSGLAVSGAALAVALAQNGAAAGLPASVASSTIQAASLFAVGQAAAPGALSVNAVALAEGVLKTMLLTKLKLATAVLVVGALAFGMSGLGLRLFHGSPQTAQGQEQKGAPRTLPGKEAHKPRTDQELIQGTWVFVSLRVGGKNQWNKDAPPKSLTFTGDKVRFLAVNGDGKEVAFHSGFKLDPSRKPKEIDMTDLDGELKGKTTAGLYELDGDTLRLCHPERPAGDRPRTLESRVGSTDYLWTLKRAAKADKPADQPVKEKQQPADPPGKVKKEDEVRTMVVSGIASAVDAQKNTLTFDANGAAEVAGKTFPVVKNASIMIDGKPGQLAELPAGSYVNLTLTVDQQAARCIGAQGPRVAGVVKAVDAGKNTLTVDDTTYMVAKDATIVIDGKRGSLAELPTGANVNVNLRVDQKTVSMIQTKAP